MRARAIEETLESWRNKSILHFLTLSTARVKMLKSACRRRGGMAESLSALVKQAGRQSPVAISALSCGKRRLPPSPRRRHYTGDNRAALAAN